MAIVGAVALIIAGCQTTPTAATTGSLAVNVTPADATVSVAGPNGFSQTFTGSKLLEGLEPGSYTVSASKDGYVPQDKAIVVEAGQTTTVEIALEQAPPPAPDTGSLAVNVTPADATVSVAGPNGFSQTFTGSKLLEGLEPGSYTVSASKDGYVPQDKAIVVEAGQTTTVEIALEQAPPPAPDTGNLAISVTPADATVSVAGPNGYSNTFTGSQLLQDLEPGGYTVSASRDGYVSADQAVVVTAGETTSVDIVLQPIQQPSVALNLNKDNLPPTLNVSVQVDEGVAIKEIRLYVDDELYETRVISTGAGVAPLALQYDFTIDTAEYDAATGTPRFLNGTHTIKAEVESTSGGIGQDEQQINWTNDDFIDHISISGNHAVSSSGADWYGNGDVEVTLIVVNYSGASYSVTKTGARSFVLENTGGAGALPSPTSFSVGGGAALSSASGLTLLFAQADNTAVEGPVTFGVYSFNLDNLGPSALTLMAQRPYETADSAVAATEFYNNQAILSIDATDAGVGVDAASARVDLDNPGTLVSPDYPGLIADGQTASLVGVGEATYSTMLYIADLLGNAATPAAGADLQIDNTPPVISPIELNASLLDGALINIASAATYGVATGSSAPSFANPIEATVSDASGQLYDVVFALQGADLQNNAFGPQAAPYTASFAPDGNVSYDGGATWGNLNEGQSIVIEVTAIDQAGNESTLSATFGLDVLAPTITLDPNNTWALEAGQSYSILFDAEDTLELASAAIGVVPAGTTDFVQFGSPLALAGTGTYTGSLAWTAMYSDTSGVEPVILVSDWAGNAALEGGRAYFLTSSNFQDYLAPDIGTIAFTPNPVNNGAAYVASVTVSDRAPAGVTASGISRVEFARVSGEFVDSANVPIYVFTIQAQGVEDPNNPGTYEAQFSADSDATGHYAVAYDGTYNYTISSLATITVNP